MSLGQHLPLGQRIPASLHAVSVSIPTMADVIGYEEKRPEIMAQLPTGYPRFVVHSCLKAIESHWQRLFDKPGEPVWLTCSEAMAKRLQAYLAPAPSKYIRHRGVSGVRLPPDPELNRTAKLFLQHVGGFLSTRQAEDYLILEGLRDAAYPENACSGDGRDVVLGELASIYGIPETRIELSASGMNAVYAAFAAISELQGRLGRHSWIKLGWLYTDTMHILDKLSHPEAQNEELLDVFDLERLEAILKERGSTIAGIITEAPTNPLIQTPDLDRIHALARQHGAYFIVDPTVNSPANLDVSGTCDLIVNSLTKYAASEGDVIMGAVAVTDACRESAAVLAAIQRHIDPPYVRDVARLAAQIGSYRPTLAIINRNTQRVVAHLQQHPQVKAVYWALEDRSAAHYSRHARSPDAVGGLIAFECAGPMTAFHDRIQICKGPSFGLTTSLLCPFIYLAHYDLVTSARGRERLQQAGISPELLRFSIGTEPVESIIAALDAALSPADPE